MSRPLALSIVLLASTAAAADEATVLGRTVSSWNCALASNDVATRHLAAWALVQAGEPAADALRGALSHDDPAVRYWAVLGVARGAGQRRPDDPQRAEALAHLRARLADPAPSPRIAAAEEVARLTSANEGLSVLVAALGDPQDAVRIQAITSLERLGKTGAPARDAIERADRDSSEYVRRISSRLIRLLGP
jgi:HEAT repeat protein